jgi:hypothetical protein
MKDIVVIPMSFLISLIERVHVSIYTLFLENQDKKKKKWPLLENSRTHTHKVAVAAARDYFDWIQKTLSPKGFGYFTADAMTVRMEY